jgi:hypothetical protein
MQTFDHNIGFWEKRQFFRQKLTKIAENCDHYIDPGSWDNWKTGDIVNLFKKLVYKQTRQSFTVNKFR